MRDSCCLHRSEKLEAGPEIWKAYYAGFPTEDHFAANISCSGVSTRHQSGTWQPPFPSSPRLMQLADTVQLFVSDCSPATHGREGGGWETKPLWWSCGQALQLQWVACCSITAFWARCSLQDHQPWPVLLFAPRYGPEQGWRGRGGGRAWLELWDKVLSITFQHKLR